MYSPSFVLSSFTNPFEVIELTANNESESEDFEKPVKDLNNPEVPVFYSKIAIKTLK